MTKNKNKKAFTLVELLVVISILAVLASVTVVGYMGFTEKAHKSVDEQLCTQYNHLLKAEQVEANNQNRDLTLVDLVNMIEGNGIKTNHFMTSSKTYQFAYYKDPKNINSMCVLLDRTSGEIMYPESAKGLDKNNLWSALLDGNKVNNHVKNYAIFKNENLSSLGLKESVDYNIDFNKHTVIIDEEPGLRKLTANNGYVIYKNSSFESENITIGETAEDVTNKKSYCANRPNDNNLAKIRKHQSNISTQKGTVVTFDNVYFFNETEDNVRLECYNMSGVTDVVFNNCVFDNYLIKIFCEEYEINFTFNSCEFNNNNNTVISNDRVNNLTIKGCHFNNCTYGIKLYISKGKVIIEDNVFNLIHYTEEGPATVSTDNAITFNYNMDYSFGQPTLVTGFDKNDSNADGTYTYDGNIIIKNNVLLNGNSLFSLHYSWINSEKNAICMEKIKNCIFNATVFSIEGNTTKEPSSKAFYKDPTVDTYTDPSYSNCVRIYNEMCTILEGFLNE